MPDERQEPCPSACPGALGADLLIHSFIRVELLRWPCVRLDARRRRHTGQQAKLPLSPQWGEEASLSDRRAVWPVLPQERGPHAGGHTSQEGPLVQSCQIREDFLEEVTAKLRPWA